MKKIFGVFFITILVTLNTNAQRQYETPKFRFSTGGGIVSGNFGGLSLNGFGFDVIAKTDISETLEGFGQIGYNSFSGNIDFGISAVKIKSNLIPILMGVNYKAGNLKPGIGIGFTNANSTVYDQYDRESGSDSGFTISPQLGYSFEKIDLVAQYFSISASTGNANGFGLKAFYKF